MKSIGKVGFEIKGHLEMSLVDWDGEVSSIIFLAGCNFRCPYCHNHGLVVDWDSFPTIPWSHVRCRLQGRNRLGQYVNWLDGVVVSGGEPTLSPGLPFLITDIKRLGFKVKLDTNGSRPEVLRSLLEQNLLDYVAMDVKGPLDDLSYARAAGRAGVLESVKRSLKILADSGVPYVLRTTVVPGLHSEKDILRLAGQLTHAPEWILQKFNPDNAMDCSLRRVVNWAPEYFEELRQRAMEVQAGAA